MTKRWGLVDEDVFAPLAWWLHGAGIRPSLFTLLQAPVYVLQLWTGINGDVGLLFWAVVVGIVLDGADGIMARLTRQVTVGGAALDTAFDVVGIAVLLIVAAVLHPDYVWWCTALGAANAVIIIHRLRYGGHGLPFTRGPLTTGLMLDPLMPGAFVAGLAAPLVAAVAVLWRMVVERRRAVAIRAA